MDYSKIPDGAKVIFKAVVGSRAFGTSVEGSDSDIKGVYIQHSDDILGLNTYQEHAVINKDETYYEIRRFIELLCKANPTCLELVFSPADCILINEPEFSAILETRDLFITKRCIVTFGHYAMTQLEKGEREGKNNWTKNLLHCRRMVDMALEIATTGKINVRRPNREFLLSIKNGDVDFEILKENAKKDFEKAKVLSEETLLSEKADKKFGNQLLVSVRHKFF